MFLILLAADMECFQIFLNALAKKYSRSHALVFVDGAGNHISGDLVIPSSITLSPLPAHSPEFNPRKKLTGARTGHKLPAVPQARFR